MYWLKRGGLPLYQKFLHIARPIKWRDRILDAAYGSGWIRSEEKVISIERFSEERVYGLTTDTGNYIAWGLACSNSQYQQFPGVRGGAIIRRDWWNTWKSDDYPPLGTVVVSVDTAIGEKETNDFSACTVWGAFAAKETNQPLFLLLEAWRVRCDLSTLVQKVAETCRGRKCDYLLIEDKTRGRDVAAEIIRIFERVPWDIQLVTPKGDKLARMQAVSGLFSGDVVRVEKKGMDGVDRLAWDYQGGVVYAPNKQWADDVISEVAAFPYGQHDDWCDTVSMALGWCRKFGVVTRREEFEAMETDRNTYKKLPLAPYGIR